MSPAQQVYWHMPTTRYGQLQLLSKCGIRRVAMLHCGSLLQFGDAWLCAMYRQYRVIFFSEVWNFNSIDSLPFFPFPTCLRRQMESLLPFADSLLLWRCACLKLANQAICCCFSAIFLYSISCEIWIDHIITYIRDSLE